MKKFLATLTLVAVAILVPAATSSARTASGETVSGLPTSAFHVSSPGSPICLQKVRYTRTKVLPSGLKVRYTRTKTLNICN